MVGHGGSIAQQLQQVEDFGNSTSREQTKVNVVQNKSPPNIHNVQNRGVAGAGTVYPINAPIDNRGTVTDAIINISMASPRHHYVKIGLDNANPTINLTNLIRGITTTFTLDFTNIQALSSITFNPTLSNAPTFDKTINARNILHIVAHSDSTIPVALIRYEVVNGTGGGGISFPITPTVLDLSDTWTGTQDIDLTLATAHVTKIILDGNATFTFSNPPPSLTQIEFEVEVKQDGTGGYAITWPITVVNTPTIDTDANATTIIVFRTNDNGATYRSVSTSGTSSDASLWANFAAVSDVDVNGNDIIGVANIDMDGVAATIEGIVNLQFFQTAHSINSLSGEMDFQVDSTDFFRFIAGGVEIARFEDVASVYALNMQEHAIDDVKDINFDVTATYAGAGAQPTIGYDATATELRINVPTASSLTLLHNNVDTMEITDGNMIFRDGFLVIFNPDSTNAGINIGQIAGDPSSTTNGDLWYNASTNKLRTKENSINVDVVGGGGANTALSNLITTSINQTLLPNSSGAFNLGSSVLHWGKLNIRDIEVETGGSLTINKNNIVSDAGGMTINTPTGDTLIHSINGVDNVIFDEDEIGFRTGRAHKISATNTSLQLISEVTADNVEFWTGASRANETIAVQDEETIFKTDATNAVDYEVLIRRSHATTTGQPAIGYYGWEAEDSVNAFSAYAAIVAVIDTDTSTDRNGRLQIVVADGNTAAQRGVTQITGVGLDIQGGGGGVKIGVYGATPVVQPSGTGETTGFTAGAGTGVNDDSTFTGNLGSKAYRINDIVKALKQAGWLVQS